MSVKMSLQEAAENLTVAEVRAIERHYGKSLDSGDISGTDLNVGLIWALERREALAANSGLPSWDSFDNWTMKELNSYFTPEEEEVIPSEPETESGKGV